MPRRNKGRLKAERQKKQKQQAKWAQEQLQNDTPFFVGQWVCYLNGYPSSQYGIVIDIQNCNHSTEKYPIGYFETGQIRYFSFDFAKIVSRSEVPVETAIEVAYQASKLVEEQDNTKSKGLQQRFCNLNQGKGNAWRLQDIKSYKH